MPELPEVETIRRDLKKAVLNKKIVDVSVNKKSTVKSDYKSFLKILKGNKFKNIQRIGKLLIFVLEKEKYLLIHLKMTGQLIYKPHPNPLSRVTRDKERGIIVGGHEISGSIGKLPNKHTRVILNFKDKSILYFNDLRRFGYLKIVSEDELEKIKEKFGIEPLTADFIFEKFKKKIGERKKNIKAILMDQTLISGIGNIYADEILFAAGIRPTRIAVDLKENELRKIFKSANEILKKAIKMRGTTFSDYVDSKGRKGNFTKMLKVYGREGEKCFRCGGVVKKIKLGGRGTRFCEKCQK